MKKIIKKTNINKKGFTLIEMLVALAVFMSAITSAVGIMIAVVRTQNKSNIQRQSSQDARFAMETICREVRMATGSKENLPFERTDNGQSLTIYNIPDYNQPSLVTSSKIERIWNNEKQIYQIAIDDNVITSDNINVTELSFSLNDNNNVHDWNIPSEQPYINITIITEQQKANAKSFEKTKTKLRTTVTSRDYKYDE